MLKAAVLALLMSSAMAQAEIIIGVAGPFSGQNQNFAQQTLNGARLAIDEINASGGINGEVLRIVTADDQCGSQPAEQAAQKLIAQSVDVVIGHFCSISAIAASPIYEAAGVTLIATSATLPALTEQGRSNVIRFAMRSDAQGAFAAKRILDKRPNAKVAVVDDDTPQMQATAQAFIAAFGKDPTVKLKIAPEQKDFSPQITELKNANVDTVYLSAAALDAGEFLAQAKLAGLELKTYGPDSLLTEQFWEAAGDAGKNTLVSFPSDPEKSFRNNALLDALRVMGEDLSGSTLPSYVAVQLFAQAAKAKGPHSGLNIAEYLKSGVVIQTSLGPMQFDQQGDATDLRFTWFSWNNGAFEAILDKSP